MNHRIIPTPDMLDEVDPRDGTPVHYLVASLDGVELGAVAKGVGDGTGAAPWLPSATGTGGGPAAASLEAAAAWVAENAHLDQHPREETAVPNDPADVDQDNEAAPVASDAVVVSMARVVVSADQLITPGEIHVATVEDVPVLVLGHAVAIPFALDAEDVDARDLVDVARRFQAAADVLRIYLDKRFPDV